MVGGWEEVFGGEGVDCGGGGGGEEGGLGGEGERGFDVCWLKFGGDFVDFGGGYH